MCVFLVYLPSIPIFLQNRFVIILCFNCVIALNNVVLPQSLSLYGQNQDITHILDNLDVYVLPVMNPDGYEYTWSTVIDA